MASSTAAHGRVRDVQAWRRLWSRRSTLCYSSQYLGSELLHRTSLYCTAYSRNGCQWRGGDTSRVLGKLLKNTEVCTRSGTPPPRSRLQTTHHRDRRRTIDPTQFCKLGTREQAKSITKLTHGHTYPSTNGGPSPSPFLQCIPEVSPSLLCHRRTAQLFATTEVFKKLKFAAAQAIAILKARPP